MKLLTLTLTLMVLALAGCQEGPAESLGEGIDSIANDIGDAAEEACEKVTNRPC